MKREDVKAKIPGITDEQLNWLMSENGMKKAPLPRWAKTLAVFGC